MEVVLDNYRIKAKNFIQTQLTKAEMHGVRPRIFVALYIFSFLPFYFGLFLAAFGAGAEIASLFDLFTFEWENIEINNFIIWGIIINQFGYFLPYFYILFFGKNLKWYIYFIIYSYIVISISYLFFKIAS